MAHPVFLNRRLWKWLLLIAIYFALTGSPIYYKPAYHGRVVDADTGEPIRGAIVAADYMIEYFIFLDQNQTTIKYPSVQTDENGGFYFPSTFRFIGPFSWPGNVYFSVDKEGYAPLIRKVVERCLSSGCEEEEIFHSFGDSEILISSNLIKIKRVEKKGDNYEFTKVIYNAFSSYIDSKYLFFL